MFHLWILLNICSHHYYHQYFHYHHEQRPSQRPIKISASPLRTNVALVGFGTEYVCLNIEGLSMAKQDLVNIHKENGCHMLCLQETCGTLATCVLTSLRRSLLFNDSMSSVEVPYLLRLTSSSSIPPAWLTTLRSWPQILESYPRLQY